MKTYAGLATSRDLNTVLDQRGMATGPKICEQETKNKNKNPLVSTEQHICDFYARKMRVRSYDIVCSPAEST